MKDAIRTAIFAMACCGITLNLFISFNRYLPLSRLPRAYE